MKKYRNKYRVPSARAPFWDYGWNAFYFITICTHNRICWFGNVVSEKMALSDIGKIVKTEWIRTFQMRPDMNLMMGEYVVMPNHFHAIIGIGNNQYNSPQNEKRDDGRDVIRNIRRDAMHCVSTGPNGQNGPNGHNLFTSQNKFGPQ
jgi:putative transposase